MKKQLFYILCAALLGTACANNEGKRSEGNGIDQCLMANDYAYQDLLTKADIAKYVHIDEASYKMKASTTKGQYGSCEYEWLSDRPDLQIELLGQTIKGADKNRVKLKQLGFYTDSDLKLYKQADATALFDQSYKRLSQQEYDELLANLEKKYAQDAGGLAQAKGFLDARLNMVYEPLSDLGDRAYWKWHEQHGIELVVLIGAAHFTVEAKLSEAAKPTLDATVKFAQEVLAKCEG